MNIEEYNKLRGITKEKEKVITAHDLQDKTDRTLLYGYTCERDTWHIYLQKNHIYAVIYKSGEEPEEMNIFNNLCYVPDKRLYPETCDFEFCKLLKEKGIELSFTTWNHDRPKEMYYGKTL